MLAGDSHGITWSLYSPAQSGNSHGLKVKKVQQERGWDVRLKGVGQPPWDRYATLGLGLD